jgi:chromosome segregation ATPase
MSHLRNEAAAVNARINSASKAVSTLQAEAQRDIGYELVELRNALNNSSLAIKSILRKHKRRYFSLALVQSQSQEAAILEHSINHVAEWLDYATKLAGRSHAQSQSYYLKALDLPHTHIKPAKDSVQRLKWNISTAQAQLDREIEDTKILVAKAEEELRQVRRDIAQKEWSISISQQNIQNKKHEINRLEWDKYYVEVRRHDKLQRAAALREVGIRIDQTRKSTS